MKTALQELLDELDLIKIVENHNFFMVKYIIEKCLQKEKEQIIDAYENGYEACDLDEVMEVNKKLTSGDLYYNMNYNQNK